MNEYENYLSEKLKDAETKIESLYYQLSLEQQICAAKEIDNGKLIREIEQLKQALRNSSPTNGLGRCWSCDAYYAAIHKNRDNANMGHNDNCAYVKLIRED